MTPADTSVATILLWAAAISTLISVATVIWNIFSGPSRKNGERIGAQGKETSALSLRVAALEQKQSAMPTKDDMHALHLGMSEMRGDLREMRAAMEGNMKVMGRLETIVTRHEDHLLEGSKR
jgi:hypothetical protein